MHMVLSNTIELYVITNSVPYYINTLAR